MKNEKILIYPSVAEKQYIVLMEEISNKNLLVNERIILIRNKRSECTNDDVSFEELIRYKSNNYFDEFTEKKLFFSIREICNANRQLKVTDAELKNSYINLYHNLKKYIIENNVKKIISYSLSDGLTMTLYNVATEVGVGFNYLINTRIGEGVMNSTRADTGPKDFELKFNRNKKIINHNENIYGNFLKKLNNYNDSKLQPKYASDEKLSSQKFFDVDKKNLIKLILKFFRKKDKLFKEVGFAELIIKRLSRAIQIRFYHKKTKVNCGEDLLGLKYLVFPLHYHPESSTLINGRWIHDQIKIIQLIVANMPANYKLIVKEHKVAIGRRPISFYKNLVKIPDVLLADEKIYIGDLIKNSNGLITISGTAGLEAYLSGKKIGVIGDVYYMHAPGVIKFHDVGRMRENIYEIIDGESLEEIDRVALYKTLVEEGELIDSYLPTNTKRETIQGMIKLLFEC